VIGRALLSMFRGAETRTVRRIGWRWNSGSHRLGAGRLELRTGATLATAGVAFLLALSTAAADAPGTDGGPADRGCAPVLSSRYYVGASGRVSCGLARRVAARSIRGRRARGWRCTGAGSGFGHCHKSRGRKVHWAVND